MNVLQIIVLGVCAYSIGAIPSAYIIAKLVKGIDIRTVGSGNVGATNVFRAVGKKWGILVFILDILKGYSVVMLVNQITGIFGWDSVSDITRFFYGFIAICGHNWTIFLNFKGGKGVSTTIGVFLGLFPLTVLITFVLSLAIIFITHYVSVGSISGAILFPLLLCVFERSRDDFLFFISIIAILSILIILKHRSNISRLLKGTENKIY